MENPKSKIQNPNRLQDSVVGFADRRWWRDTDWSLELEASLKLGAWSLKLLTLALLFLAANESAAADRSRPTGPSRDEFKDVVVYNIFDPSRGPKPPPPPPRREEKRAPAPPRTDRLTLTGIIMGTNGNYGFFDGSDRDFQRAVQQGEKLAEFDVAKITTDSVDLKLGTNSFQLRIRGELSKRGDEAWKVSASSSGSYSKTSSSTGSRTASGGSSSEKSTSSSSDSGGGGADAERKKRLLELLKKRRSGQ